MRLDGKVVLISGGARGQGAAEAKLFVREGAKVVIGDILDVEGQKVEAEIVETGGECVYIHLDVTSDADWQNAVGRAVSEFGRLDVLVNNAGVTGPRAVEDTTSTLWTTRRAMSSFVSMGNLIRTQRLRMICASMCCMTEAGM